MRIAFTPCLSFTFSQEGGFVDDPDDAGGATNLGITVATLSDWRKQACTPADVRGLSRTEATAIYGARYWNVVRGDDLPIGLDLMVFDHGVLAGTERAARLLQIALRVPADGHIGTVTATAAARVPTIPLIEALAASQASYYEGLGQPKFERGWLNRVKARQQAALTFARAHA